VLRGLNLDKINRPSRLRWAIGLTSVYSSTCKASPNDSGIIVIIITVGEEIFFLHTAGIIAYSSQISAGFFGLYFAVLVIIVPPAWETIDEEF
jgi:hypothetical protein